MLHGLARSYIALSCSRDGFEWSEPLHVSAPSIDGDGTRTVDQPVAGGIVVQGHQVHAFVHRGVPNIATRGTSNEVVRYIAELHVFDEWSERNCP